MIRGLPKTPSLLERVYTGSRRDIQVLGLRVSRVGGTLSGLFIITQDYRRLGSMFGLTVLFDGIPGP